MKTLATCKLCMNQKELKESHAVGYSVFKKIFRQRENSGKAIVISANEDDISYSSDSWSENQLCSDCESLLNSKYEAYSLGVLRGNNCKVSKTSLGVTFSGVDQHKLTMYFLSIYWRAANSSHPAYKNVRIIASDNTYLRKAIFRNERIRSGKFSVRIRRVIDLSSSRRLTPENIKELIVSPFIRSHGEDGIDNISTCFMFEGFFIEVYMRALRFKHRNQRGVLSKTKSMLVTPYLNLFDIDEVIDLMVTGYGKHVDGRSKIKARKNKSINCDR